MSKNAKQRAAVRVSVPHRTQHEFQVCCLDDMVPPDHRVRYVWKFVDSMDLSALYAAIQALPGSAGRDAIDPRILLCLWLYATIDSVSSGREIVRRCTHNLIYKWICGGVSVNDHTVNDFRSHNADFLSQLLSDSIATMMHQGLVSLEVVAQDGVKVRASAGKATFRREPTLKECHQQATAHVKRLLEEGQNEADKDQSKDQGDDQGNARREAAQKRAAQEREQRMAEALKELEQLQAEREQRKKGSGQNARASTTDPQARVMVMPEGGYRPAYNVQFASDGAAQVIVAVDVTNRGNDGEQMSKMHEHIVKRYSKCPESYLVDGGFANHSEITAVEKRGTQVYAPVNHAQSMLARGKDPYARQKRDTDESFAFRQRMATDEAKALYKRRSAIAEFPNAECRNRGMLQFKVRGLKKVRAVALLYANAFNLLRMISLKVAL